MTTLGACQWSFTLDLADWFIVCPGIAERPNDTSGGDEQLRDVALTRRAFDSLEQPCLSALVVEPLGADSPDSEDFGGRTLGLCGVVDY